MRSLMNVYVVTMCVCSLRLYPACCVHNLTSPDLSLSLCVCLGTPVSTEWKKVSGSPTWR